jgi:hypothetical protein
MCGIEFGVNVYFIGGVCDQGNLFLLISLGVSTIPFHGLTFLLLLLLLMLFPGPFARILFVLYSIVVKIDVDECDFLLYDYPWIYN